MQGGRRLPALHQLREREAPVRGRSRDGRAVAFTWLRAAPQQVPRRARAERRLHLGTARLRHAPAESASLLLPRAVHHHELPLRKVDRAMNELTPLERVRAYYRDLNTGDVDTAARHFHPDANHFYTRI